MVWSMNRKVIAVKAIKTRGLKTKCTQHFYASKKKREYNNTATTTHAHTQIRTLLMLFSFMNNIKAGTQSGCWEFTLMRGVAWRLFECKSRVFPQFSKSVIVPAHKKRDRMTAHNNNKL